MLVLNAKRIFGLRGIERATSFLVRHNFIRRTADKILKMKIGAINFSTLEQLCVLLNCTPNDLFEWRPDSQRTLPEKHSLNSLIRDAVPKSYNQLVRDVPSDKLELIEKLLNELKK